MRSFCNLDMACALDRSEIVLKVVDTYSFFSSWIHEITCSHYLLIQFVQGTTANSFCLHFLGPPFLLGCHCPSLGAI